MGKRKRGRSVKRNLNQNVESEEIVQAPHSFVIHKGLSGGNTIELTKDFRRVMEPFTASSLKERKKNTIKDFVAVAGPLHVSHLSIFSRTEVGMYLKVTRLPRGPTLTFKIHNFSLARDVVSSLKKQVVVEEAFKHSPLVILNSFSGEGMHLKMMASMFQNMFPTLNLTTVDLNTVRRCVLLNFNPSTKLIDFRHYNIKIVPVGVSKGVKKVVQGKIPNLSRCEDITDFFSKAGILSESEADDDPQNHVTLPQKIVSRGNIQTGKSTIKLSELGPRLLLQLIKIEDGLLDGEVLYHDIIHKTEEEKSEIAKRRELKKKLKEKRKKQQEANKKAKDEAKHQQKEKSLEGMKKAQLEQQKENPDAATQDDDDDREYYRQEVGEEPDKDLFSAKSGIKRKFGPVPHHNKKQKLDDREISETKTGVSKKKSYDASKIYKKFNKDKRPKERNKVGKNKRDKINSQARDYRPIGGRPKFKAKFKKTKRK